MDRKSQRKRLKTVASWCTTGLQRLNKQSFAAMKMKKKARNAQGLAGTSRAVRGRRAGLFREAVKFPGMFPSIDGDFDSIVRRC